MTDDELFQAIHLAESLKDVIRGSHSSTEIMQAQRENNRTLAHLEAEVQIRKETAAS